MPRRGERLAHASGARRPASARRAAHAPASPSGRRARRPEEGQSTTVNSVSCIPSGRAQANVAVVPGRDDDLGQLLGARRDEPRRNRRAVVHLEGDAHGAGDARCRPRSRRSRPPAPRSRSRASRGPRRGWRCAPPPPRPPTTRAPAARARRGRTRAPARSRRRSGRGGAPYRAILPHEDHPGRARVLLAVGGDDRVERLRRARRRAPRLPAAPRRARNAGSGSTTTTSNPARRSGTAWMPAKPSSSTRAGGSPSSSRIRGVALAASAGGSLTARAGRRAPRSRGARPRR